MAQCVRLELSPLSLPAFNPSSLPAFQLLALALPSALELSALALLWRY